jgi:hypothetical protein
MAEISDVERAALANAEIRAAIAETKAGDRPQLVTRLLPEPDGEAGA